MLMGTLVETIKGKTLAQELRANYVNMAKWKRVFLAFAGFLLLVSSSSELWFGESPSVFQNIPPYPYGLVLPTILSLFLFLFHSLNWRMLHQEKLTAFAPLYGFLCTIVDVSVMLVLVVLVYSAIGQSYVVNGLASLDMDTLCKVLYLAVPLALGEFTLSSALSSELRKARELEKRLEASLKKLDKIVSDWSESERGSSVDQSSLDPRIARYVEKKRGEKGDDEGERRGRGRNDRENTEVTEREH